MVGEPHYTRAALREVEGSTLIKVKAVPGASRDRIAGLLGDSLKICVSAPAERGRANDAICRLLARQLGLKPSRVSVEAGATGPEKWIRLEGLALAATAEALGRILPVGP